MSALSPAKVLVVTDYDYPTGGIEEFIYELTSRLRDRFTCQVLSWTPHVRVPGGTDVQYVTHGDVRVAWSAFEQADVILAVTSFNMRILARLVLDYQIECGKPLVTVVQTSGHSNPGASSAKTQQAWFAGILARSSAVVAVSGDVAAAIRLIARQGDDLPPVVVIENAARLRADGPVRRGHDVVGFIGRPVPQKGFPLFTRLARSLSGDGLRFVANTVSLPPARPVPEISVSYNCTDSQLLEFFASIDVLVAPYLQADGLPLALQEAMNCGVPVIGFDSPGVGDVLGRHGQIVIDPTYEALEQAVTAWRHGTVTAHPPLPGSIIEWDYQAKRYADLIMSATSATAGRYV
jgi:glycosyltransferase involved in cell wall biosynthesis